MAMYSVKSESLTAVADAIRAKTGGTDLLAFPEGMVEAIGGMSGGGGRDVYAGVYTACGKYYTADVNGKCVAEVYAGGYTITGSMVIE